jgi:hypothetical protein
MRIAAMLLMVALMTAGCEERERAQRALFAKERAEELEAERNAPCRDSARLIATTTGSPDDMVCPNKLHRIEVQPATLAGEEIGATVTCRCVDSPKDGGTR